MTDENIVFTAVPYTGFEGLLGNSGGGGRGSSNYFDNDGWWLTSWWCPSCTFSLPRIECPSFECRWPSLECCELRDSTKERLKIVLLILLAVLFAVTLGTVLGLSLGATIRAVRHRHHHSHDHSHDHHKHDSSSSNNNHTKLVASPLFDLEADPATAIFVAKEDEDVRNINTGTGFWGAQQQDLHNLDDHVLLRHFNKYSSSSSSRPERRRRPSSRFSSTKPRLRKHLLRGQKEPQPYNADGFFPTEDSRTERLDDTYHFFPLHEENDDNNDEVVEGEELDDDWVWDEYGQDDDVTR